MKRVTYLCNTCLKPLTGAYRVKYETVTHHHYGSGRAYNATIRRWVHDYDCLAIVMAEVEEKKAIEYAFELLGWVKEGSLRPDCAGAIKARKVMEEFFA